MKARAAAAAAGLTLAVGCGLFDRVAHRRDKPPAPPTFSHFRLDGWAWDGVGRVLVLPFRNESDYTRAGDEVRAAFVGEFQRAGRLEVVAAPADDRAPLAAAVRQGGRFDEGLLLEIGREARADVVVHGTVTQYTPYPRPRLGLVLQAVAPREGRVVASVDGLWDSTDGAIADRVKGYYRQRPRPRPPWVRNHVIADDDGFAAELALDSPALFQRYVCYESVCVLLGLPVTGLAVSPAAGVVLDPDRCPPD